MAMRGKHPKVASGSVASSVGIRGRCFANDNNWKPDKTSVAGVPKHLLMWILFTENNQPLWFQRKALYRWDYHKKGAQSFPSRQTRI